MRKHSFGSPAFLMAAGLFALLAATSVSALIDLTNWPPAHQKVIFDTDISMDVDDVGALAMVHKFADICAADIIAIGVSMPQQGLLANIVKCVDAIDTYYGRPNIPIGVVKRNFGTGQINSMYVGHFSGTTGPNDIDTSRIPEGCVLYEQVLTAQADTSVTIIITGYPTNLTQLLQRTGGVDLVRRKVKMVVQMGGWNEDCCGGREGNLCLNTASTRILVDSCPAPIMYSGFQEGAFINSGAGFRSHPSTSPVSYCWSTFNYSRSSWDPIATLFAFRGKGSAAKPYFTTYTHGYQTFNETDGSNKWNTTDVAGKRQGFIKQVAGNDGVILATLDSIFALMPAPTSCGTQAELPRVDAAPSAHRSMQVAISSGRFIVSGVSAGSLELFDETGRMRYMGEVRNGEASLGLSALSSRVSLYRVKQAGRVIGTGIVAAR